MVKTVLPLLILSAERIAVEAALVESTVPRKLMRESTYGAPAIDSFGAAVPLKLMRESARPRRESESAVGRQGSQDDKKTHGRLVHVDMLPNGSLTVFGFELRTWQGEILTAEEWAPLDLGFDCGVTGALSCVPFHTQNSERDSSKQRIGFQLPADSMDELVSALAKRVTVDVFYPIRDLSFWAKPVIMNGPLARMEVKNVGGEQRLLQSALTLMVGLGKTVLVLSTPDKPKSMLDAMESALLKHSTTPPLWFLWPRMYGENLKSRFPSDCLLVSNDYWGREPDEIHATPDREPVTSLAHDEDKNELPVLLTSCHARSHEESAYILGYGRFDRSWLPDFAEWHDTLKLPVKLLTKHPKGLPDPDDLDCSQFSEIAPGVNCIPPKHNIQDFHDILQRARAFVYPCTGTPDNPSALEALACGTPVLMQKGCRSDLHQMLTRFGERPYVTFWENRAELGQALREIYTATSHADHKLAPWWPSPLRHDNLLAKFDALMRMRQSKCDAAAR